jgi:hypothetical protein
MDQPRTKINTNGAQILLVMVVIILVIELVAMNFSYRDAHTWKIFEHNGFFVRVNQYTGDAQFLTDGKWHRYNGSDFSWNPKDE